MSKDILSLEVGDVQGQLRKVNQTVSSIYLHFPFCKHLCNYCDFYKKVPIQKESEFRHYQNDLIKYFNLNNDLLKKYGFTWAPLRTLYFGGGTPSLWGPGGIEYFFNLLSQNDIVFSNECEVTLEVNPGSLGDSPIKTLQEFQNKGINRFSVGVQTLHPFLSKKLDRAHSIQEALETLRALQELKANYSVDLMLGLPFSEQEKRQVEEELAELISFGPSHFSVYILTTRSNYKYQPNLPSEEYIEKEYLSVCHFLAERGFLQYEVSNFSLENKESRHNLKYWHSEAVVALGPSAAGFLPLKDGDAIRYKWKSEGILFDLENLDVKKLSLENLYLKLRLNCGITFSDLALKNNEVYEQNEKKYGQLIGEWQERGLAIVEWRKGKGMAICLTSKGLLMQDSLMGELFSTFKSL